MSTADTRRRILDAAQRLIESGGLARLTTKDIAREADCAEGTLFNHFKTKEDLCLAVVLENAPKFKDAIVRKRAGAQSVEESLQEIALACIQFSEKLIPLGVTLFADADLLERHRELARASGRGPKEAFELIAGYVRAEQELGRINSKLEPMRVASLLFGSCFHWVFIRQGLGKSLFPMKDKEYAAEIVATLMLGLAPAGTASKRA
jgi:AcrR family transcriptional regulator